MRLAYLIPEFPGQTHAFFWNERRELMRAGVHVELLSTRRPGTASRSTHAWTAEASELTTYLLPLSPSHALGIIIELASSGPASWLRLCSALLKSEAPGLRGYIDLLPATLLGVRVARLARIRGLEHVHVHSCANAANVAMFAHAISGIPYSVTLHSALRAFGPNQAMKWSHAEFAIVITEQLEEEVRNALGDHVPTHLTVAPMGVDVTHFKRTDDYVPFSGAGPLRLFSCSRLHRGKGVHDLVHALELLRRQGRDAQLKVAGADGGDGTYASELRKQVHAAGLEDHVVFLGSVSAEDIRAALAEAHVFVLGSYSEALGVALMEAMAMQLPIVATRVGGIPSLVHDGIHGYLVDSGSPEQMAAAIERIAADPEFAMGAGTRGRERVEKHFHSGMSAAAIVESLRSATCT